MSHRKQSPAIVIARHHQSAPAEHWADTEIKRAAEEIDGGRYVPDSSEPEAALDGLGLSLGFGTSNTALGKKPTLEEFRATRDLNELGRHPRVVEALERLKLEAEKATDSQEAIEKAWMLHELTAESVKQNRWQGQERWEGEDSEAMRRGRLLTPIQFHAELCKVIGNERVLLSTHAVKVRETDKSGRVGLYVRNPEWRPTGTIVDSNAIRREKAAELRSNAEAEHVRAKRLRLAGHNAEADKAFQMTAQMVEAATQLLIDLEVEQHTAPKEFLRVGSLQWPLGTEWMVMNFDEYGVPTTAKFLGWRTALLTMVRQRVITEREANQAFPVGSTHAADWYRQQMKQMRDDGATHN